jgi:hypothetical protein
VQGLEELLGKCPQLCRLDVRGTAVVRERERQRERERARARERERERERKKDLPSLAASLAPTHQRAHTRES